MKKLATLFVVQLVFINISVCQWTQQESNTTNDLNDVFFLNDSVGFVAGNSGSFLKTSDRGETWELSIIESTDNLHAVFALNEDTIFAGGDNNLYKTIDGGESWTVLSSEFHVFELKFFSSMVGFLKTSWVNVCYDHGGTSSIISYKYYRTLDGGETWYEFNLFPICSMFESRIDIVTADTGYIGSQYRFWSAEWFCASMAEDYFFKTTDGGITWEELSTVDYTSDVAFINGFDGFLIMEHWSPFGNSVPAEIYKISEGGEHHTAISSIPDYSVDNFFFANQYEGYYIKDDRIVKTSSGGIEWIEDYTSNSQLTNMALTQNYEAFITGKSGTILHKKLNPVTNPDSVCWISHSPDHLDFPMTGINSESNNEFILSASGNVAIIADVIAPANFLIKLEGEDEYVQEISGLVINPSHDTTITVSFRPDEIAYYDDDLIINSNANNFPNIRINLKGRGVCMLPGTISNDTVFCIDTVWVNHDVTVNQGCRLTFCPGTVIVFKGEYDLDVNGSFHAVGTPQDSIKFTPESENNVWHGIYVLGDDLQDSIVISYCLVETSLDITEPPVFSSSRGIVIHGNKYATIRHSLIRNCSDSYDGGGICCTGSDHLISDCKISNCVGEKGGGIYLSSGGNSKIINCEITGCMARESGGGIYCESDADSVISDCIITDCHSDQVGGGIAVLGEGFSAYSCQVSDCSSWFGGGVSAGSYENSTIFGFTILSCSAEDGGGIYITGNSNLSNCRINNCEAEDQGGAICNFYSNATLIDSCTIWNNRSKQGGAIYLTGSIAEIKNNWIQSNSSFSGEGGGIHCNSSSPLILNNILRENQSDSAGAAIFINGNFENRKARISQNLLYMNYGRYNGGGGIYINDTKADILLNTIWYNRAFWGVGGGILCASPDSVRILGNILFANEPDQVGVTDHNNTILSYCDISGGWNGNGDNNINLDPRFYELPHYPWYVMNYDFSLAPDSPCIDSCIIDTSGLKIPSTDFAGNPRIANGRMDIGAYENNFSYQTPDTGVCVAGNISLIANPDVEGPYSCRWTHNGEIVTGAVSNILEINDATPEVEGFYQCTMSFEGMNLYSRNIYLSNYGAEPVVQAEPQGAVLHNGDTYELSFQVGSQDPYVSYQWFLNDAALNGATDYILTINNFSKEIQGAYKCRAENHCGVIFSTEAILQLDPSYIVENKRDSLYIHPNPAGRELTVDSWQSAVGGRQSAVDLAILDLFGRVVLKIDKIASFPYQLDISGLQDGMYVLRLMSDQGEISSVKFLKISR